MGENRSQPTSGNDRLNNRTAIASVVCKTVDTNYNEPNTSKLLRPMTSTIRDIVRQAIATGYLSLDAENQLRNLLSGKYALEDFQAFVQLQQAAMVGRVRQESREAMNLQSS